MNERKILVVDDEAQIMFIDLGLETMTGFELCERIRQDNPDAIWPAIGFDIHRLKHNSALPGRLQDRRGHCSVHFTIPPL